MIHRLVHVRSHHLARPLCRAPAMREDNHLSGQGFLIVPYGIACGGHCCQRCLRTDASCKRHRPYSHPSATSVFLGSGSDELLPRRRLTALRPEAAERCCLRSSACGMSVLCKLHMALLLYWTITFISTILIRLLLLLLFP